MKGTIKKTDSEIKEELIVKNQGYLRLPKRVRDHYGNPKAYPNPDVIVAEINGKLIVTFEFDLARLPKNGNESIDKGSGKYGKTSKDGTGD